MLKLNYHTMIQVILMNFCESLKRRIGNAEVAKVELSLLLFWHFTFPKEDKEHEVESISWL